MDSFIKIIFFYAELFKKNKQKGGGKMKFISPEEWKRLHPDSKIGVETIKRMIKSGEMKGIVSQNGDKLPRYYVEVDENEESGFSKEYVEKLCTYAKKIHFEATGEELLLSYKTRFETKEEMLKIRDYLYSCGKPQKIELLPYHAFGEHKYPAIGKETPTFSVPADEKIAELKSYF